MIGRHRIIVAAIGAAACLAPAAFSADSGPDPSAIWQGTCHSCHDTGIGPQILGLHIPADRVKAMVRNGGLEMSSFTEDQISDAELDALADWVNEQDAPAQ